MGMCIAKPVLDPVVQLKSIEAESISLRGLTLAVQLEIINPNPYQLQCVRIHQSTRKKSDGTVIAEGSTSMTDRRLAVPALGSIVTTVPITATYGGVFAAGESILNRGKTELILTGDMTFQGGSGSGRGVVVPFSLEGVVMIENESTS